MTNPHPPKRGVRGPAPDPNARRRGVRVAISPAHARICDRIAADTLSRADVVELALEAWERALDAKGLLPPPLD